MGTGLTTAFDSSDAGASASAGASVGASVGANWAKRGRP